MKNQVISLDAMGCQRVIADDIKSREGDYLLAVKGNQKKLHDMFLERLPFRVLNGLKCDKHSTEEDNSRGRKMIRDYYVIQFNEKYGYFSADRKGLESLCVAVTYRKNNKDNAGSLGIRYFISSKKLTAMEFGMLCRGHWGVESMHWWLDAVMKEDESKIVYKNAAENLSRIRQMCMNFIKLIDMKGTLKKRQLKCALNTDFREMVLFGD